MMRLTSFTARGRLFAVAGVVVVAVAGVSLALVAAATGASPDTSTVLATFNTHGTYTWTVPSGVRKVTFDVFGASGGNVANGSILLATGGQGGEARGQFSVKPGQTFEVVVGGPGTDNSGTGGGLGGFNGGGQGNDGNGSVFGGAGGGGSSDVRLGGSGNPCANTKACGVGDRFIVGGGGGGGGGNESQGADNGGTGGGVSGVIGGPPPGFASPGTQEGGGLVGASFGFGGTVAGNTNQPGSGGGGAGWYGGGACCQSGGGGGSGFVSPFAHKGTFPGGTHGGDGLVVISTP